MGKLIAQIIVSFALLALAAGTASGVPCGPSTCASLSTAVTGSKVLVVRPHGQLGPLVAYNLATGRLAARLPAGLLSADGRRYVTAANVGLSTRLTRFNVATGARLGSLRVGTRNLKVGALSADGRYAATVRGTEDPDVFVVDLDRGRLVRTVHLAGGWSVDALSRDGRKLYLIQRLDNGKYRVRVHDSRRGLVAGAITDPKEPEPMTGLPWASSGTRDGDWQLTLYLKPGTETSEAFVHALSLDGARAACIDLPGGEFMAAGRYALVPAPDGRTLYAANPSLGVVATIDLGTRAILSTVHFAGSAAANESSAAFGALSPNGKTLYFSAGRDLFAYDTGSRAFRGRYDVGSVAGIGFHPSGRTVLVVKPGGGSIRVDASTGKRLAA